MLKRRPTLLRVTLLTSIGLLLGLGCMSPVFWWVMGYTQWGFLSDSERQAHLEELTLHYEPLIAAVHRHAEDHGRPPSNLAELVPDYLEELPDLEPKYVDWTAYYCYLPPGRRTYDWDPLRYAWYALTTHPNPMGIDWHEEGFPPWGPSFLVLQLSDDGDVRNVWVTGSPPKRTPTEFDVDGWLDIANRPAQVASVMDDLDPVCKPWDEVRLLLGPPDGLARLGWWWMLHVSISRRSGFTSSVIDRFWYYSDRGIDPARPGWGSWVFNPDS